MRRLTRTSYYKISKRDWNLQLRSSGEASLRKCPECDQMAQSDYREGCWELKHIRIPGRRSTVPVAYAMLCSEASSRGSPRVMSPVL